MKLVSRFTPEQLRPFDISLQDWEQSQIAARGVNAQLLEDEADALIGMICAQYRVNRTPVVEVNNRRKVPAYEPVTNTLEFPRKGIRPWRIIHELTHFLSRSESHDQKFTRLYIDLLCRYLRLDRSVLVESAARFGII